MYEQAQFTTLSIIMHFLMESTFSIFWKPVSCHNRLDAPVTSSFCHAVVPFLKSLKNASLDSRFFVSVFAHYLALVFLESCMSLFAIDLAFVFLESCVSVFALDLVFVFLERCAQLSSHVIWKMQWSARAAVDLKPYQWIHGDVHLYVEHWWKSTTLDIRSPHYYTTW